jgi:hypothetical protein
VRAEIYEAKCTKEAPSIQACTAIFCKMTLVTSRLDRTYDKAIRELQRIKAAPEKQPEPPQEPSKEKPSK